MFPDQQNQNGGQPPQPAPPAPYGSPGVAQTPTYGVNSAPQQTPGGQYQVVPPPSVTGRPTGHNPYEFIVSPPASRARGSLFGGNDFIKKIVLIVGGAVLVMIVATIVISALAPKKDNTASLTAIAQAQQEIVRVATTGATQATSQTALNFATNVELGVGSSQSLLIHYLASKGTTLKAKQLALDQSAQTDKLLADALTASTFDSVMVQTLNTQLTSYEASLRTAYNQNSSSAAKQILQSSYNAAALLLEQAKSTGAAN